MEKVLKPTKSDTKSKKKENSNTPNNKEQKKENIFETISKKVKNKVTAKPQDSKETTKCSELQKEETTEVKNKENSNKDNIEHNEKIKEVYYPTDERTTPKFIYKRTVYRKLTIILIENTLEVIKQKDVIVKIVDNIISKAQLISIINYSNSVMKHSVIDVSTLPAVDFKYLEGTENKACLYDAIQEMKDMISKYRQIAIEDEYQKIEVNRIEIIAIGTCKDNCSKVSKETTIESFNNIISMPNISCKCFCLKEANFINAAEIGFHSIGAICREYIQ